MILQVSDQFKNILSKDLGAISGLLFDIGVGKVVLDENAPMIWKKRIKKERDSCRKGIRRYRLKLKRRILIQKSSIY